MSGYQLVLSIYYIATYDPGKIQDYLGIYAVHLFFNLLNSLLTKALNFYYISIREKELILSHI